MTPATTTRGTRHLVASADHVASRAGDLIFERGGNAVDAAIATNAAIAVTGPHLCGMGGDLFALIHTGDADVPVVALNSSGRSGAGVDADQLRSEGHTEMPFRHDVRSVTVPGCVDGWIALHERFGSMPLSEILDPALDLAANGFAASPLLAGSLKRIDDAGKAQLEALSSQANHAGAPVRLPGVARALAAIAEDGRNGFYGGEFGAGLLRLAAGVIVDSDLEHSNADWVAPLTARMFGVDVHTIGPNSQGYLTLGGGLVADTVELPDDPDDPRWAHLLIEAAKIAAYDRPEVLHEHADGNELLAAIADRAQQLDPERASWHRPPVGAGDTTYLCTAQADGMAVSLIQSNASGFGSWLAEPNTGINLHNRGLGFSLVPGNPAEAGPGRRPPHTLSPALATTPGGALRSVFGTMGGDAQPQILLQIAARLFRHGESAGSAIHAGRWALAGAATGFDTWASGDSPTVQTEGHAAAGWDEGLTRRGHTVARTGSYDSGFGHAHAITVGADGVLAGAADPRTWIGSVAGR